jgi:CoA-binding domain
MYRSWIGTNRHLSRGAVDGRSHIVPLKACHFRRCPDHRLHQCPRRYRISSGNNGIAYRNYNPCRYGGRVGCFVDLPIEGTRPLQADRANELEVQVRALTIIWIGVFIFLAGCAFALKIGDTFSSVTIISFAAFGLCCLIAQRTLWRTILENGLASGKLAGRTIVLISDSQSASNLQQVLLRHGFRVRRHCSPRTT